MVLAVSTITMSLRRSTRGKTLDVVSSPLIGSAASTASTGASKRPSTKRLRKTDTDDPVLKPAVFTNDVRKGSPSQAVPSHGTNGDFKLPVTPAKRRKVQASPSKPPPVTPTPSVVGFMMSKTPNVSYSTPDIDDPDPPARDRLAEPHVANAPVATPDGSAVVTTYSNFEESPSKLPRPTLTTATLLEDAKAHLISVSPALKAVIDKHHCRVFSPEGLDEEVDPFRSLASGIMAQQVSGAAASSIKNKFIGLFSASTSHAGPPHFPPPAIVAQTPLPVLRTAGLSQRKAEYIQGLAEKFVSGELSASMLAAGTDEEVMEKLVAVRGLGRWSVEMFCCFALKRMDIFSTGDLGVQRGMAAWAGRDVSKLKAKGGGKWKYMSEKDMLDLSAPFSPYRSLFMWMMWRWESPISINGTDVSVQDA